MSAHASSSSPRSAIGRRRTSCDSTWSAAEYTHVGEDCTFQTLLKRFGLDDRALAAIGEIVHDIDCKDEKYSRPETAGVLSLLRGIAGRYDDDEARMGRGFPVFDDLYAFYSTQRGERQRMKWITRERPRSTAWRVHG